MAVAAWLVWRRRGLAGAWLPLTLLGSAGAEPRLVRESFGLRRPGMAFGEILLLWAAILATLLTFGGMSRWAAGSSPPTWPG